MILGIDPGTRRIGVAVADLETRFARPLETIAADRAIDRIAELTDELEVTTVVVGRPLSLSGEAGPAVETYRDLVGRLRAALPPEVALVEHDERLTSVIAERELQSAGVSAKKARGHVDEAAARVMLQGYLDSTRRQT